MRSARLQSITLLRQNGKKLIVEADYVSLGVNRIRIVIHFFFRAERALAYHAAPES